MRLVALLLLLANIVLVALDFERRLNAPPPPRDLPAFEGRVRLQLVDELAQLPPLRDSGLKPPPPAPPPPLFGPTGTLTAGTLARAGAAAPPPAPPIEGTTYAITGEATGPPVDPDSLAAIDGTAPLDPTVAPGFEGPGDDVADADTAPVAPADATLPEAAGMAPGEATNAPSDVASPRAAAAAVADVPAPGVAMPISAAQTTTAGVASTGSGTDEPTPDVPGALAPGPAPAGATAGTGERADTALADANIVEPPAAEPPAAPTTSAGEVAIAPATCLRYGPFAAAPAADAFQRALAGRGVKHKRFVQDGEPRKLFWVYLEQRSKEEAQSAIDALAKAGVKDYLLIKRAGIENAISLGVFSSQESVNRRLAEMSERGYQPLVVPRYEPQKTHWVDVAGTDVATLQALADEAGAKAPGTPLDCASLGRTQ